MLDDAVGAVDRSLRDALRFEWHRRQPQRRLVGLAKAPACAGPTTLPNCSSTSSWSAAFSMMRREASTSRPGNAPASRSASCRRSPWCSAAGRRRSPRPGRPASARPDLAPPKAQRRHLLDHRHAKPIDAAPPARGRQHSRITSVRLVAMLARRGSGRRRERQLAVLQRYGTRPCRASWRTSRRRCACAAALPAARGQEIPGAGGARRRAGGARLRARRVSPKEISKEIAGPFFGPYLRAIFGPLFRTVLAPFLTPIGAILAPVVFSNRG